MKKSTRALLFISGLLLTALLAFATDITGRVTVRGAPLAGAVVTANLIGAKGAAAVVVTKTGTNGQYSLQGLANGSYILLVDLNSRRIYQGSITLTGPAFVKNIDLQ
jgi:redox-regulated HSP33 family molecular chaperone